MPRARTASSRARIRCGTLPMPSTRPTAPSSVASRENFCADGLKFRDFYYNWDSGHRYVLNLRENETYTRYYQRLGTIPDYWVGSERTSAPESGRHVRDRAVGSLRHARQWHVVVLAVVVGRRVVPRRLPRGQHHRCRGRSSARCRRPAVRSRVQGPGRQRHHIADHRRALREDRSRRPRRRSP